MSLSETIGQVLLTAFGYAFVGGLLSFLWYRVSQVRWHPLAKFYASDQTTPSKEKRFESMTIQVSGMAFHRYRAILAVGVYDSGITLRLLGPFSIFHPPLSIPFADLTVVERRWFLMRAFQLTAAKASQLKITIFPHLYQWILDAAGDGSLHISESTEA